MSVTASATVKDTIGAILGTINPIQCWDTQGVVVGLAATDNAGGSGVKQLAYRASGAQVIARSIVTGSTASVPISAAGLTTLTYSATDTTGNQEASKSLSMFVGSVDNGKTLLACAAPTPTFALPAHGTLVLTGTVTVNGLTSSFSKTFKF